MKKSITILLVYILIFTTPIIPLFFIEPLFTPILKTVYSNTAETYFFVFGGFIGFIWSYDAYKIAEWLVEYESD